MSEKMKKWAVQEEEVHNLRESLSTARKMIVERADHNGLSLKDCADVVEFINQSLKR